MSVEFDVMSAVELRARIGRREVSPVDVSRRALDKANATRGPLADASVTGHDGVATFAGASVVGRLLHADAAPAPDG